MKTNLTDSKKNIAVKKAVKRWFGVLLAIAVVVTGSFFLVDNYLHASEGDGSTTAEEQQQITADVSESVEVSIPSQDDLEASAAAFEDEMFSSLFGDAETAEDDFQASAELVARRDGDQMELTANIVANADYSISWEYNDGDGWKPLNAYGLTYTFTATEATAGNQYRFVVTPA